MKEPTEPCKCGGCATCRPGIICRFCGHYTEECECENERDDYADEMEWREMEREDAGGDEW